jgi:hypothetical protein
LSNHEWGRKGKKGEKYPDSNCLPFQGLSYELGRRSMGGPWTHNVRYLYALPSNSMPCRQPTHGWLNGCLGIGHTQGEFYVLVTKMINSPWGTVPQISPRWQKNSYLYPNHQNPPAQWPRSAPDGKKTAISTQTIKTHLHSAPDQLPMAGK